MRMLRNLKTSNMSTSSAEVSHVRMSVQQAIGEEFMTVRDHPSGGTSQQSSNLSSRASSLSKMLQAESRHGCLRCGKRCTCLDTERVLSSFLLEMLGPFTRAPASSLLPTPMARD